MKNSKENSNKYKQYANNIEKLFKDKEDLGKNIGKP